MDERIFFFTILSLFMYATEFSSFFVGFGNAETNLVRCIKGIVQPFELGGETRLIRS